VLLADARQLLE